MKVREHIFKLFVMDVFWCTRKRKNFNTLLTIIMSLVLFLVAGTIQPVQGGMCWTVINSDGRCKELLAERISQYDCCHANTHSTVYTAWSDIDLDPGTLFFWRALGGGVKCAACKESCDGVTCEKGKKCQIKTNGPRCICDMDCTKKRIKNGKRTKSWLPVCGTDGVTYRNVCRLRKRACRKNKNLRIAYYGPCQSSCNTVQCMDNKKCILDQNLIPHCVKCQHKRKCLQTIHGLKSNKIVCGADGQSYNSVCHLKEAACNKGKAIPIAYKGRCKQNATCSNLKCGEHQKCLVDLENQPRCVTCDMNCQNSEGMGGPICGTNDITYKNWCHMIQDACSIGYLVETKYPGNCTSTTVWK